jgi:hypothetical protein
LAISEEVVAFVEELELLEPPAGDNAFRGAVITLAEGV